MQNWNRYESPSPKSLFEYMAKQYIDRFAFAGIIEFHNMKSICNIILDDSKTNFTMMSMVITVSNVSKSKQWDNIKWYNEYWTHHSRWSPMNFIIHCVVNWNKPEKKWNEKKISKLYQECGKQTQRQSLK